MSSPNNMDWSALVGRRTPWEKDPGSVMRELQTIDPQAYVLVSAAQAVHAELGFGYLPEVYRQAFAIEMEERGVACQQEVPVILQYHGRTLPTGATVDFVCYDDFVVAIRTREKFDKTEDPAFMNVLRLMQMPHGLLLNFGPRRLEFHRFAANGTPGAAGAP